MKEILKREDDEKSRSEPGSMYSMRRKGEERKKLGAYRIEFLPLPKFNAVFQRRE